MPRQRCQVGTTCFSCRAPASSPAAYFGAYEWCKIGLAAWQGVPTSQLGSASLMAAGGIGGAAFWVLMFPVDVVKSRLQTQNPFAPDRYLGMRDCTARLWREEGWRAFFRGYTPCLLRSVPANCVTFLVFEKVKSALQ